MTRRLRSPAAAGPAVTTGHTLLTSAWTLDVEAVEAAIARFGAERRLASDCQVILFELAGDDQLHVNVIHHARHPRVAVRGWSGPGELPDGCVYNRRFADGPAAAIVRHIRTMVFA